MIKCKLKYLGIFLAFFTTLTFCSCKKSSMSETAKDTNTGIGYNEIASQYDSTLKAEENKNTEEYKSIDENTIKDVLNSPLSTFSIDVDTASYSNLRRFINSSQRPPESAVRIEEMINYFSYDYPQPENNLPFSITTEVSSCPWNNKHQLALIGIQGKKVITENLPPSNLVFLLDVSGSMNDANKLPLVKSAMKLLVDNLTEKDKVSIVVYAGAAGTVLPSTPGSDKEKIIKAINNLSAGGSTAGGQGITLAYKLAKENFIKGGNNRVILATDGDFNVGVSSEEGLVKLIEEKRKDDIFLSVLGFGDGNLKDNKMEALADKGNGNYAYIDTLAEAKKVLVEEMSGTLLTIAKDVKIQVEFNPAKVKGYKLIGYENRKLENKDFKDDSKDAGELGAGHTVTAFYELVPASSDEKINGIDNSKYQLGQFANTEDLMTVKLRYKDPDSTSSKEILHSIKESSITKTPSNNFNFASSAAEFGLLLRNSEFKGTASYDNVIQRAKASKGSDLSGYRAEFIKLVEAYRKIAQ